MSLPCGQSICYPALDHLGSTRLVTDGTGSTTQHYDYQPFGTELLSGVDGRSSTNGYLPSPDGYLEKFTGQQRDQESTLDWFQTRYMDPSQGRFQSPDPGNAGAQLGDPQTWNGYSYVENNPLSLTDPSGLGFWSDFLHLGEFTGKIAAEILGAAFTQYFLNEVIDGGLGAGASGAVWGEELPAGVNWGGGIALGSVFGGGSAGGVVFNVSPDEAVIWSSNGLQGLGKPSSYLSTAGFLFNFLTGTGPKNRRYGPNDYRTQSFMKSAGFQQNMQKITSACRAGQTSGTIELGTLQGGLNLIYDSVHSPVGAQVGGYFGGTWTVSGGTIKIAIPNDAGAKSFFYHKVPNSPFSVGPLRTINQHFEITVANPCSVP